MATVQRLYIQNASGTKTYLDAHSVDGVPAGTIASASTLGMSKVGNGLSISTGGVLSVDGTVGGATQVATKTTAGIVKIGAGLSITADGTLSSDVTTLPVATSTTVGVVKPGTGLTIDVNGGLNVVKDIATATKLGEVMVGTGLAITTSGVLMADPAIASATQLGVVKIGKNINVTNGGEISVDDPAIATTAKQGEMIVGDGLKVDASGKVDLDLPIATDTVLGGVKIGDNIDVDATGVVSVKKATTTDFGVVMIGDGLEFDANGAITLGDVDITMKQDNDKKHNEDWMADNGTVLYLTDLDGDPVDAATTAYFTILENLFTNKSTGREELRVPYADENTATLFAVKSATKQMLFWIPKLASVLTVDYSGANVTFAYSTFEDFMTGSASIPTASKSLKGIVQIGDNIDIDTNGLASVPVSTASSLGVVKPGDNLTVAADGTLTANVATDTVTGVIKQGQNVTVAADGTLTAKIATNALAGVVMPNGTDFSLNTANGLLRVNTSDLVASTDTLPVKSSAVSAALGDYNHDWVADFENALV